jgi:mono/diheme cytochrome c family protein
MKVASWFAVILFAAMAQPSRAEGDPERGLAIARQVCSECHAVQAHQLKSPNERAPTFLALSTTPGMTATALTVALTTPHAGMPMFRLTAEQRDGVIAYILGLKQSGSPPGK